MTGFLNAGVANPLSRITAASMADLGYVININAADPYSDPSPIQGLAPRIARPVNSYIMLRPDFNVLGLEALAGYGDTLPLPVSIAAAANGIRIWDLVSGSMDGIALTGLNSTGGKWQFTTNGGSSWTDVGSLGSNAALTLAADLQTRLRFIGSSSTSSPASITFGSWDRSSGTNGGRLNASAIGSERYVAVLSQTGLQDLQIASAGVFDEVFSSM
jgi:hypothetical protein